MYSYDVICKRTILNERGTTSIIEANGWCIMRSIIAVVGYYVVIGIGLKS